MHYYTKTLSLLVCFAAVCTISTAQQPPASVSPPGVALIVTTVPPAAVTATAGTTTNGTRGGCGGRGKNKDKGRKTRDVLAATKLHDEEPQPRNAAQDDSQKFTGEHAYMPHLRLSKRSPKKSDSSSSSEEAKDNSNTKPVSTISARPSTPAA